MRTVYQEELRDIQTRLVEISELVEGAIEKAVEAFANSDVVIAEAVIDGDAVINEKAEELDSIVVDVIARQQPVATDLRLMVSSLRMSASLERMADLAQHIAELARYRYPESAVPKGFRKVFDAMGQLDIKIAKEVTQLLREQNLDIIGNIRDIDDEIDELHARVFEKVLGDKLAGNPTGVVDATLASRYHERFGDHAVNIAKQIRYFVLGELS